MTSLLVPVIIIAILIPIGYGGYLYAPWVPSGKRDLERILKLANLKKDQTFLDLGSGDGRTVFYIAKNTEAKAIGFEIAWPLYLFSILRKLFYPKKIRNKTSLKLKNFFNNPLPEVDVIYTFGLPKHIKNKLKSKLIKETKKGTKVISYIFPVNGWEPVEVSIAGKKDAKIYMYEMN